MTTNGCAQFVLMQRNQRHTHLSSNLPCHYARREYIASM